MRRESRISQKSSFIRQLEPFNIPTIPLTTQDFRVDLKIALVNFFLFQNVPLPSVARLCYTHQYLCDVTKKITMYKGKIKPNMLQAANYILIIE